MVNIELQQDTTFLLNLGRHCVKASRQVLGSERKEGHRSLGRSFRGAQPSKVLSCSQSVLPRV